MTFLRTVFGGQWAFRALIAFVFFLVHPAVVSLAHAENFLIQTGYYLGNATDDRAITGVGFQPDLVMIKTRGNVGNLGIAFKTSAMAGETTLDLASTIADQTTDHIQSLDSDGFTVGTDADVNTNGNFLYWVAFGGSDCSSSGTFCVGSYTGNGTSQSITGIGFQPDLVIVKRSLGSTNTSGIWKSNTMASDASNFFDIIAEVTTGITSLDADGFSVGNHAAVNVNTNTYYFVAFREIDGFMNLGTYTGNATIRDITSDDDAGLTFRPDFVFTKGAGTQEAGGAMRDMVNKGFRFRNTVSNSDWNIRDLLQTGGFRIAGDSTVNQSGVTYYYAAFAGAPTKSVSGTFNMTVGSYTGTGSSFAVTGLGFAPDLVMIKHHDQATDQYAVWRHKLFGTTGYFASTNSFFSGGIASFDSDGFTVGTHATVNTDGDAYYWAAFGNAEQPGLAGGAADFLIGAYAASGVGTNNGPDDQYVWGWPFAPHLLMVKRGGVEAVGVWRTVSNSGDETHHFQNTASITNSIQELTSEGFFRGSGNTVNYRDTGFFYFAFATSSRFTTGSYTANSGTPKDITDVGFQPDLLWVKKVSGGTARVAVLRTSAQAGDAAQPFNNAATLTGAITALTATGFSIGSGVTTNEGTATYQWAAWDAKRYAQQVFRFFENTNTTDVGGPLEEQNGAITLAGSGSAFRLRLLLRVDGGNLFANGQEFKLQFAGKGAGTCTSPSGTPSSYTDVTSGTVLAFKNNTLPADGDALSANGEDPIDGSRTIVNQTYEEENNFTNSEGAIENGQDGKWDFSLFDNGAAAETTYCFRVVRADGTPLDEYVEYPEVRTAEGGNAEPTVHSVEIDNDAAGVTLIEGTTKDVVCSGVASDGNGYTDIDSVQAIFFRTSVGTSTPDDKNHKYTLNGDSECVPSGGAGNEETYTCTFAVWYYADPTDAGSPNASDTWTCEMRAYDGVATSSAATDTIEMNSLIALSIDPVSVPYGVVIPGNISTGQFMTITNTGNRDMDPELSGTPMTAGPYEISPTAQKYFNAPFFPDEEGFDLSITPTVYNLTLPKQTDDVFSVDFLYWGLVLPLGIPIGDYEGVNTLSATEGV